jgi:alginate O-acetyltransferase complex protein AlgI
MSFVSLEFVILFVSVYLLNYVFVNHNWQNFLLFVASCVFYGWWDARFLALMAISTAVAYCGGLLVHQQSEARRRLVIALVCVALLTILGFFKYYDFFVTSFASGIRLATGSTIGDWTLHLILPVGISFYTFQAIAYVVDVSRNKLSPERNFITFGCFKLFFPQLVAGPIERAPHLLPQFQGSRKLSAENLKYGLWLCCYGYFMKVVVADTLAQWVNVFYADAPSFGWSSILGTLMFGLQIYGDFLGYSLIAKGCAIMLGIELVWNFNFPYWATSISDFWRRWHISLSTWLRDYLFIPIGGSRGSRALTARNLAVTMTLGGLWHGANWTLLGWGVLHGGALIIHRLLLKDRFGSGLLVSTIGWLATMAVVFVGWFLFRVGSLTQVKGMVGSLENMTWGPGHTVAAITFVTLAAIVAALEYVQIKSGDRAIFLRAHPVLPTVMQGVFVWTVLIFLDPDRGSNFIYFQF